MTRLMRLLAPTWYGQVAPLSAENASDARVLAEVKTGSQERLKRELFAFLQEVSRLGRSRLQDFKHPWQALLVFGPPEGGTPSSPLPASSEFKILAPPV